MAMMVPNSAQCDVETLIKFFINRADVVHESLNNEYQTFLNAFVFINKHLKRQDAVSKGQELWWNRSTSDETCTVFEQAIDKMKKLHD